MARCNCSGSSCGCLIVAGDGATVTGTGTANDPFVVTADLAQVPVGSAIAVSNSTTIEFGKKGTGTTGDPVVITAGLALRSPNNTRWSIAVGNDGTLSAVPAGPSPTGSLGSGGGVTVIENDLLYYDGTNWEPRSSSAAKVIWSSLGYTGVPIPTGFKKGDTWLCEAT